MIANLSPYCLHKYTGVVVQCIDFSPITQEPGVQFRLKTNAASQTAERKDNRGCTNVQREWRFQWAFHEPWKELMRRKR